MIRNPLIVSLVVLALGHMARGGEPVIEDARSRTFTVGNTPAPLAPEVTDIASRIFTVSNVMLSDSTPIITDARSRRFTVRNDLPFATLQIQDARSRIFTVRNNLPTPTLAITDVAGRVFSVRNNLPAPDLTIETTASRGFTVLNCYACRNEPDLCGAGPDCNLNGINDECDLYVGFAGDCNGNGVIDDCEVTACPTCLGDVNGDGAANGDDIEPFVDLLLSNTPSPCGDINLTGGPLDPADVAPFVCRLLNAAPLCP